MTEFVIDIVVSIFKFSISRADLVASYYLEDAELGKS